MSCADEVCRHNPRPQVDRRRGTIPAKATSDWEDEVLSWHCAGTAMRDDRNRTKQTRIRARTFILLLPHPLTGINPGELQISQACTLGRYGVNPIYESRRG